ncbi:MAG: hypothetical protein JO257_33430 [Deltaproteobacteria bacterium]|nr:hypothetical protein [Deltaproteobacteria bacterium]
MRFLVTAEASKEGGDRLDSQPGGPGPFFGAVAERFRPEAFWVRADRRAVYWVLDLADATQVAELMHLCLAKAGAYPTLTPILTGDEARTAVPAAIEKARR